MSLYHVALRVILLCWFGLPRGSRRWRITRKSVAERYRNCRASWLLSERSVRSWRERFGGFNVGDFSKKNVKWLVFPMQVNYLENDNVLLENKQKELKGTLNNLLQSRESFVHAYEVILLFVWRFCCLIHTPIYMYLCYYIKVVRYVNKDNASEWCYISLQYLIYKEIIKWKNA